MLAETYGSLCQWLWTTFTCLSNRQGKGKGAIATWIMQGAGSMLAANSWIRAEFPSRYAGVG